MPKSLKELNWPLFAIEMASSICSGVAIALAGKLTGWTAVAAVSIVVVKSADSFFKDAKKQLEG